MDNKKLIDNLKTIQEHATSMYTEAQKTELRNLIEGYSDLIFAYRTKGGIQISPQFTSECPDLINKTEKEFSKAREFFLDDLEKVIDVLENGGNL